MIRGVQVLVGQYQVVPGVILYGKTMTTNNPTESINHTLCMTMMRTYLLSRLWHGEKNLPILLTKPHIRKTNWNWRNLDFLSHFKRKPENQYFLGFAKSWLGSIESEWRKWGSSKKRFWEFLPVPSSCRLLQIRGWELSVSSGKSFQPNFHEPLTHQLSARQTKDPQNPQHGRLSHLNKKRWYPRAFLL